MQISRRGMCYYDSVVRKSERDQELVLEGGCRGYLVPVETHVGNPGGW